MLKHRHTFLDKFCDIAAASICDNSFERATADVSSRSQAKVFEIQATGMIPVPLIVSTRSRFATIDSLARLKQIPSIISAGSHERRANTPFVVRERSVRAPSQRFV